MPPNNSVNSVITMLQDVTLRLHRLESSSALGNSSIRSGALQILDANGRVAAAYGFQPDGTVGLVTFNPVTGAKVIAVGTQTDGTQGLAMFNPAGQKVLQMGQQADGTYSLIFDNPATGVPVLQVGPQADGTEALAVFNASGARQAQIGQLPGGLYGLSVLNSSSGLFQLVAGSSTAVAASVQTSTTGIPTYISFSDDPVVSATIGPSGQALVGFGASMQTGAMGEQGLVFLTIDGTPIADHVSISSAAGPIAGTQFTTRVINGITPGPHVFGLKYQIGNPSPTGTAFNARNVTVSPL